MKDIYSVRSKMALGLHYDIWAHHVRYVYIVKTGFKWILVHFKFYGLAEEGLE